MNDSKEKVFPKVPYSEIALPRYREPKLEALHSERLSYLLQNLKLIREDPHKIRYQVIQTFWKPVNSPNRVKMPDIILVRQDDSALIAELKHSENHRVEALAQMSNGKEFAIKELGITLLDFKLVYYHDDGDYSFEKIRSL